MGWARAVRGCAGGQGLSMAGFLRAGVGLAPMQTRGPGAMRCRAAVWAMDGSGMRGAQWVAACGRRCGGAVVWQVWRAVLSVSTVVGGSGARQRQFAMPLRSRKPRSRSEAWPCAARSCRPDAGGEPMLMSKKQRCDRCAARPWPSSGVRPLPSRSAQIFRQACPQPITPAVGATAGFRRPALGRLPAAPSAPPTVLAARTW